MNKEIVFLKAMEVLVYIAQYDSNAQPHRASNSFFPAIQVKTVKSIHTYILSHCSQSIFLEKLVQNYNINYTLFNTIFKAMCGDGMLKLNNVSVGFGRGPFASQKKQILSNIGFTLADGESLGIVGKAVFH